MSERVNAAVGGGGALESVLTQPSEELFAKYDVDGRARSTPFYTHARVDSIDAF